MDPSISIPCDEFLASWLKADNLHIKHTLNPICYLSRQERKTRKVRDRLEHYMFIVEDGASFTLDQFRGMLSVYLKLSYEFQLLQVDHDKFILTLETEWPNDYAYAMLEEGRMIRFAESNVVFYHTDEYADGYFGGNLAYDMDDEVGDLCLDVQIHALPLHLRTIKAVERILLRYCVVHTVEDDCLLSKKLDCITCACWAQRGTMFPKFIIIKVASKYSHDSPILSNTMQKYIQTYCVAIRVEAHGFLHPTPKYQLEDSTYFARAVQSDRIGYCFLRDIDVCESQATELHNSVLLRPRQPFTDITIQEIVEGLQLTAPCATGEFTVQSIGIQGYIARCTGLPLPQLLQTLLGEGKDIHLSSQAFRWLPWSTSFGAVNEFLTKKMNIQTRCLQTEFFTPAIVEDLLSPFCMFDTDGYNPGSSPDIHDYWSVVWTDRKRSVPSIIIVHAAPPFCETISHPKGEVIDLAVMTCYNIEEGLEAQE